MKSMHTVVKILSRACIFFTVAILLLYTVGTLISDIEHKWIPSLKTVYIVFVFSVLFSCANQLLFQAKIPSVLRLLIHYGITTLIFYILFVVWGGYDAKASSVLVILLAYTFLYAICALVFGIIRYVSGASKRDRAEYAQQFPERKTKQ